MFRKNAELGETTAHQIRHCAHSMDNEEINPIEKNDLRTQRHSPSKRSEDKGKEDPKRLNELTHKHRSRHRSADHRRDHEEPGDHERVKKQSLLDGQHGDDVNDGADGNAARFHVGRKNGKRKRCDSFEDGEITSVGERVADSQNNSKKRLKVDCGGSTTNLSDHVTTTGELPVSDGDQMDGGNAPGDSTSDVSIDEPNEGLPDDCLAELRAESGGEAKSFLQHVMNLFDSLKEYKCLKNEGKTTSESEKWEYLYNLLNQSEDEFSNYVSFQLSNLLEVMTKAITFGQFLTNLNMWLKHVENGDYLPSVTTFGMMLIFINILSSLSDDNGDVNCLFPSDSTNGRNLKSIHETVSQMVASKGGVHDLSRHGDCTLSLDGRPGNSKNSKNNTESKKDHKKNNEHKHKNKNKRKNANNDAGVNTSLTKAGKSTMPGKSRRPTEVTRKDTARVKPNEGKAKKKTGSSKASGDSNDKHHDDTNVDNANSKSIENTECKKRVRFGDGDGKSSVEKRKPGERKVTKEATNVKKVSEVSHRVPPRELLKIVYTCDQYPLSFKSKNESASDMDKRFTPNNLVKAVFVDGDLQVTWWYVLIYYTESNQVWAKYAKKQYLIKHGLYFDGKKNKDPHVTKLEEVTFDKVFDKSDRGDKFLCDVPVFPQNALPPKPGFKKTFVKRSEPFGDDTLERIRRQLENEKGGKIATHVQSREKNEKPATVSGKNRKKTTKSEGSSTTATKCKQGDLNKAIVSKNVADSVSNSDNRSTFDSESSTSGNKSGDSNLSESCETEETLIRLQNDLMEMEERKHVEKSQPRSKPSTSGMVDDNGRRDGNLIDSAVDDGGGDDDGQLPKASIQCTPSNSGEGELHIDENVDMTSIDDMGDDDSGSSNSGKSYTSTYSKSGEASLVSFDRSQSNSSLRADSSSQSSSRSRPRSSSEERSGSHSRSKSRSRSQWRTRSMSRSSYSSYYSSSSFESSNNDDDGGAGSDYNDGSGGK